METWAIYKYTVETFVSKPVRSPSCEVWFYLPKTSRLVVALHFLLERNNRLRKRRWKITLTFWAAKIRQKIANLSFVSFEFLCSVPEGKENVLSQRLTRPAGLLSAGSTPRSTPRSTPIRSLSPAVSRK